MRRPRSRAAFTLIEAIVVMAILAIALPVTIGALTDSVFARREAVQAMWARAFLESTLETVLADAYSGDGAPGVDGITDTGYPDQIDDSLGGLYTFYTDLGFALALDVTSAVGPGGVVTGTADDRYHWVEASVTWTPAGRSSPTTMSAGVLVAIMPVGVAADQSVGVVQLVDAPRLGEDSEIDTYDPSLGPYGGANVGPEPTIEIGADMPTLTAPSGLGTQIGRLKYSGGGTTTISTDMSVEQLTVGEGHTVRISGAITILVETKIKFEEDATLVLDPGATLDLYIEGEFTIDEDCVINKGAWDRLRIYNLGDERIELEEDSKLYADLVSPEGGLKLGEESEFFGSIVAEELRTGEESGVHIATGPSS